MEIGSLMFMRPRSLLLTIVCLMGCASGSSIIVGEARPPIEDWESVVITNEMPEGAETIAFVKASSEAGWTKQGRTNYAVQELQQQAAKVGANMVVIGSPTTQTSVADAEVVEGTAVYVER